MSLDSSRFFAGEVVEVRSRQEILASLDANGRLDGVPFMPEMLRYCGQRFRVYKRAHKTCDFVNKTGVRALPATVHLEGLRCDGAAHGGCQAQCMFYWKDAWLRRPADPKAPVTSPSRCDEARLHADTHAAGSTAHDVIYSCQATLVPAFTRPISPWNPRQYLEDYRSGNVPSLFRFIPRACYRAYDGLINLGIGLGRPLRWLYHRLVGGDRRYPAHPGEIPPGGRTPVAALNLQPGELVRVKSHAEILRTVDEYGKNRGMSFSAEMAPYCGGTFRVRSRVTRIIDEKTGRMIPMKTACIILDGVICQALFNKKMIFCPRATYPYWREIWLERVSVPAALPTASPEPAPAETVSSPAS